MEETRSQNTEYRIQLVRCSPPAQPVLRSTAKSERVRRAGLGEDGNTEDSRRGRSLSSVLCPLVSVVMVFIASGCAVSDGTATSHFVADSSAGQQEVLIDANDMVSDSNAPDDFVDDDFDLFEEELIEKKIEVADPLEPVNRLMAGVNDVLYFWVARPCIQVCEAVVPEPARLGIRNFFNNLATPIRLANCLLQGKGDSAGTELHRFLVNTTSGVLGFGDPARDRLGLEPAEEDLGQTLAVYGFGDGFYLVLPLLGPSTLRDSVGFVGDRFLNPTSYVEPWEVSVGISAGRTINEGSFHLGEYEAFKAEAIDPYVAMREAYIQYRNKKIQE